MLSELCHDLKNYFVTEYIYDKFIIENGKLAKDYGLKDDQYFCIRGSVFNDGVHKYPATDLVDEAYNGAIWAMAIPDEVIALAEDIKAWNDKYGSLDSPNMSPYNSESFGGYSYSKSGGGSTSDGTGTWQQTFSNRLNKWRKI